MNNDILVSPGWDEVLINTMILNDLGVATSCGVERLETPEITRKFKRRWKFIRGAVSLIGAQQRQLKLMHSLMYADWEGFCTERNMQFHSQILRGFVGNTVMIQRAALDKIGLLGRTHAGCRF